MPFGLINAGATFQRAMNSSFKDLRDKIIVIYLDDLTVYSKRRKHHLRDLEKVLERCRQHGISLNPTKSIFFIEEGKLLGHIVSKEGVKIDPERVKAIQKLVLPTNRSDLKSFFGQINFLRSFVPEFSEKVRYMLDMMSEKRPFRWQEEGKKAFEDIKIAIASAPMLVSPNFEKDFIIYCYASEHSLSSILTEPNDEGKEAPIAFMSVPLKKHELNYSPTEKHAFVVVRALKHFRYYILHSHSVVFVPETAVKSILTQ